ncbi:CG17821 [Drosophila busckii]|uniref:Elongation of very long chain fatty acids protein n=1 Tax=Drosophila busckii TaxID=30019 RepID=A0A0M3QV02_DROBS|nr:elongation of very long chain fatty acids protein F [Drosophila busckii]ALC41559.1 CG17821 [Drosophila busckii]
MITGILKVFDKPRPDPDAANWALLEPGWHVFLLYAAYAAFVFRVGRKFMENRKPLNVKTPMIVYNAFQVVYNSILFYNLVYYMYVEPMYDLRCMETLPLDHPKKNVERWIMYGYFINKLLDLLDTVFFVLRKSYKQITLLHVYHHILMGLTPYFIGRFYGFGGQFVTIALLNTLVHIVMYFYYLISAMSTKLKGSIWWKKYITVIQLVQFVILLAQTLYVKVFEPDCGYPAILNYLQMTQSITMIIMFSNFYIKSYVKTSQKQT